MAGSLSVDDVKLVLGLPSSSTKEDDRIQAALDAATAEVLAYLCLDSFDPTTYTLTADVPCHPRRISLLAVQLRPIVSITEVKNGSKVLDAADYVCRGGWVRLCCGVWCCGCRSAEITLVAGFDQSKPLQAAQLAAICAGIVDYAAQRYSSPAGGLKKEQIGRYSYEVMTTSDREGVNGAAGWPDTLSNALLPFWQSMNSVQFERECV